MSRCCALFGTLFQMENKRKRWDLNVVRFAFVFNFIFCFCWSHGKRTIKLNYEVKHVTIHNFCYIKFARFDSFIHTNASTLFSFTLGEHQHDINENDEIELRTILYHQNEHTRTYRTFGGRKKKWKYCTKTHKHIHTHSVKAFIMLWYELADPLIEYSQYHFFFQPLWTLCGLVTFNGPARHM